MDNAQHLATLKAVLEADKGMLFYGPPGTAKTTTAQMLLAEMCGGLDNVYSVTCHTDLSAQEAVGMYQPKGGEFVFVEGPALQAWRRGGGLILNEIDKAEGAVWTSLYAICDDKKVARLTLPTGETVRPHPNFRVIATSNQAVDVLPDALGDRFPIPVPFMSLTEGQIASLPERLRAIAVTAYKEAKFPHITFRKLAAFAEVMKNRQLSAEQQQHVLEWTFDKMAPEVYHAMVLEKK